MGAPPQGQSSTSGSSSPRGSNSSSPPRRPVLKVKMDISSRTAPASPRNKMRRLSNGSVKSPAAPKKEYKLYTLPSEEKTEEVSAKKAGKNDPLVKEFQKFFDVKSKPHVVDAKDRKGTVRIIPGKFFCFVANE